MLHMRGMGPQVRSGLVERVIKIQIKMMRLQVHDEEHRGHSAGEFRIEYFMEFFLN
jgi:hypothetical protein